MNSTSYGHTHNNEEPGPSWRDFIKGIVTLIAAALIVAVILLWAFHKISTFALVVGIATFILAVAAFVVFTLWMAWKALLGTADEESAVKGHP